jgi:hypothetical protein
MERDLARILDPGEAVGAARAQDVEARPPRRLPLVPELVAGGGTAYHGVTRAQRIPRAFRAGLDGDAVPPPGHAVRGARVRDAPGAAVIGFVPEVIRGARLDDGGMAGGQLVDRTGASQPQRGPKLACARTLRPDEAVGRRGLADAEVDRFHAPLTQGPLVPAPRRVPGPPLRGVAEDRGDGGEDHVERPLAAREVHDLALMETMADEDGRVVVGIAPGHQVQGADDPRAPEIPGGGADLVGRGTRVVHAPHAARGIADHHGRGHVVGLPAGKVRRRQELARGGRRRRRSHGRGHDEARTGQGQEGTTPRGQAIKLPRPLAWRQARQPFGRPSSTSL